MNSIPCWVQRRPALAFVNRRGGGGGGDGGRHRGSSGKGLGVSMSRRNAFLARARPSSGVRVPPITGENASPNSIHSREADPANHTCGSRATSVMTERYSNT